MSKGGIGARLSYRVEYFGFRLLNAITLPLGLRGPGFLAAPARLLGPLIFRARARRNLRIAMPDLSPEREAEICEGMFDHLARVAGEYLLTARLMADPDAIEIEGAHHLQAAQAAGRGAVLVTGHFGSWEAARIAASSLKWPPAIIYRAFNNPYVDRDAQQHMRILGAPVLHKGRKGSLGLLRHVSGGGAAMILIDQRFSGAPELPFFGQPARTSIAAAEIAQRYGAALIPVSARRIGRASRFEVRFEAPIDVAPNREGAIAATALLNQRIETWIRSAPEQYFWLHNRWKGGAGAHAIEESTS